MNRFHPAVKPRLIAQVLGWTLTFPTTLMALMAAGAGLAGSGGGLAFGGAALVAGGGAAALFAIGRRRDAEIDELRGRDGLAAVGLAWPLIALAGALPYWFSGWAPHFTDAFFESVSGFTATGATVLSGLEKLPPTLLLWRALSQWLGGMGVIALMLAVLPFFGVGGLQLFKNDSPLGQVRLRPRIAQTAKFLWLIYLALTVALLLLARLGGLSWFDAVCQALSAIATGGFATHDLSIAHYRRPYLEAVFALFMLLGSLNFALYYHAVRGGGWRVMTQDPETRVFLAVIAIASTLIAASLIGAGFYPEPFSALRHAVFQVVSIASTAGFASADWSEWPGFARTMLWLLFFMGGCAGSTSGGLKCARWILIFKSLHRALRQHIHPRAVFGLSLGGRPVPESLMTAVWSFLGLYIVTLAASTLALTGLGLNPAAAFSASASALGNVGLGFAPAGGLAAFPALAKIILILEMFLGRLEFLTLLILFSPDFWKR